MSTWHRRALTSPRSPTKFNDVSSWINAGVIVVPKLEVGDLGRNLTSRTVIDIQAFLNGGGKLVVMFPGSVNGRSFLNRLFGWFLASAARCRSSAGYNITDAFLGDSLYNGISFLPMVNSDQGLSISRLPASVQPVYESTYGCGGVMIAPYGSGSVVLYAYDFYFPTENTAPPPWEGWSAPLPTLIYHCIPQLKVLHSTIGGGVVRPTPYPP